MCMGYAKEIRAWVCDDARNQRELMMQAWSKAFKDLDEAPKALGSLQPDASIFVAHDDQAQEQLTSPRTASAT